MIQIVIALLFVAGAVWAARFAWRHRRTARIGSHLHCAACGRNLHGLTSLNRCPECGADLAQPEAVTSGAPRPYRAAQSVGITIGVICAITAFILLGTVDYKETRLAWTPTSWLVATLNDPSQRLSAAQSDAAVELCLRLWRGSIPDAEVEAVARALHPVVLSGRAAVRAGEGWTGAMASAFPLALGLNDFGAAYHYRLAWDLERVRVGEGPWIDQPFAGWSWRAGVWPQLGWYGQLSLAVPGTCAGPVHVEAHYRFRVYKLPADFHQEQWEVETTTERPVAEWSGVASTTVNVLAPDAADVRRITDPKLRSAILACIEIEPDPARPISSGGVTVRGFTFRRDDNGRPALRGRIMVLQPPVDLAFDMFLHDRLTGKEISIGSLTCRADTGLNQVIGADDADVGNWSAGRADLVLRVSEAAARRTTNITTIWGEDLIIPNVRTWRVGVDQPDDAVERGPATLPAQ